MAITKQLNEMAMILKYKTGVNEKGNDIIKTQKLSKVKVNVTDEDFITVGKALTNVLAYEGNIEREENYIFIEE